MTAAAGGIDAHLVRSLQQMDLFLILGGHEYKQRDLTIAVLTKNPYLSSVETLVLVVQKKP